MCKDCGCGQDNGVVTKVFHVPGMMCGNCKNTVETAALGLPGVLSASVDLDSKDATISYTEETINEEAIKQAIEDTGFEVESIRPAEHHHHHGVLGALKRLFK